MKMNNGKTFTRLSHWTQRPKQITKKSILCAYGFYLWIGMEKKIQKVKIEMHACTQV